MRKLDSFQKDLDIFYHSLNQQFSIFTNFFNDNIPEKSPRDANLHFRIICLDNQIRLVSKKPIEFLTSRSKSTISQL